MTEPTPADDAVFLLLWRSTIETLPRLIREPKLPPHALMTIPGQHWADGRARALLGADTALPDDDVADIVAMLVTKDSDDATGEPPALAEGAQ